MSASIKFFSLCLIALSEGYSELYVDAAIRLPSGHFEFFFGPYSQVYDPLTGLSETPVLIKSRYPFLPRNGTLDSALVIPQEYGGPAFFLIQGDNYFTLDPVTGTYSSDPRCLHCDWDLPLPTGISGAGLNPLTGEMFFFVGEFAHIVDVRSLSRKETKTINRAFIGLPVRIKGVLDITPLAISIFFYKHRYFIWDWNSRRVRSGDIHEAFPGIGLSPELYSISQSNSQTNKVGLIFDTQGGPVVSVNRGGLNISSRLDDKCLTTTFSCAQCILQSCSWSLLRARCEVSSLSDLLNDDATRNCSLVSNNGTNSGVGISVSSVSSTMHNYELLDYDRSCFYQLRLTRGQGVTIATTEGEVLLANARNSSFFAVKPGKQLSIYTQNSEFNRVSDIMYQVLDFNSKIFYRSNSNGNSESCGVLPRITHCGGCEQISLKDQCQASAHCTWKISFQPFSASCVMSAWKTIDAAIVWQNNTVVFFSIDQFKEYNLVGTLLASGTLGQSRWAGIPVGVNAAFSIDGEVYVFKGSEYWKFDPRTNAVGTKRSIGAGFSGLPSPVRTAMNDLSSQAVYFFDATQGYHVPFQAGGLRTAEPPFNIEDKWYCVPEEIEAAFAAQDTYYFFKGENFWEIVNNTCVRRYTNNRFKNLLVTPSPLTPTIATSLSSTNTPTSALPPSAARSNVTKPYLPPSPAPPPIISLLASASSSSSAASSSSSSVLSSSLSFPILESGSSGLGGGKRGKKAPLLTPATLSPSSSSPPPLPLSLSALSLPSRTRPPPPPINTLISSPPPLSPSSSFPPSLLPTLSRLPLGRGKRLPALALSFAPSLAPPLSPSAAPSSVPSASSPLLPSFRSSSAISSSSSVIPEEGFTTLPWSLPSPIDAATQWSNAVYLFSGNQYKQFSLAGKYEETGIISEGWPGMTLSNLDAAFHSGTADYFFKDQVCQLWQEAGGVQTVKWDAAIPFPIDAALETPNGRVFFFKDTNFFEANIANRSLIGRGRISQRFPGITQRVHAAFRLGSSIVFVLPGPQWMTFVGNNVTHTGDLSMVGGLVRGTCEMNQVRQTCIAPCQWCNTQNICAKSRNCSKAFQENRWFGTSSIS